MDCPRCSNNGIVCICEQFCGYSLCQMFPKAEAKISSPSKVVIKSIQHHGFLHDHLKNMSLCVYSTRGKLILWSGGKWMPINGPAIWFTLALCVLVSLVTTLIILHLGN